MYPIIKHIHLLCVALSFGAYLLRGIWMLTNSPMMQRKLIATVIPHAINGVLLLSAIAMMVMTSQYPFQQDWLTSKLLGLIAYIVLGVIALKTGKTRNVRLIAWLAGFAVFFFLASVGRTHNALGFLA